MKTNSSYQRYERQIILKEFGEEGQQKLLKAKVLVVGAGGLGCPALQYLAAAGVGKIGIVDDDVVALHNLHRQILFNTGDIGKQKAIIAAERLRQMNPDIITKYYTQRLTNKNALPVIEEYDVVLDATDNFATRYLINDACVLLKKPLVYGAISQFEGQVAVFNCKTHEQKNPVNYRDLFPEPPLPGSVQNCAEAGVLGVLPGIIGTLQATETIKLLAGFGKPLTERLFTYNALTNESFIFSLEATKEPAYLLPKDADEYTNMNYEWLCGTRFEQVEEIDSACFEEFISDENVLIIDVREMGEQPVISSFSHLQIPLAELQKQCTSLMHDTVVVYCKTGGRSLEAAKILKANFGDKKKIYSLKGGIIRWLQNGNTKD